MAFIKKDAALAGQTDERTQPRDFAGLLAQLDHVDAAVRRWAARDLLDYPGASAQLLRRLQLEQQRSVREVILTSLTRIGDEVAVAGLVDWLRSEDVQMRNEAIAAMKELPDEVAPIMGALLADPDSDVRIMAVNVLESLRHAHVEAWLIDVISNDPVVNVCGTAVDLLGEVGTSGAQTALEQLKQRFPSEPYILFAADIALKRIAKA